MPPIPEKPAEIYLFKIPIPATSTASSNSSFSRVAAASKVVIASRCSGGYWRLFGGCGGYGGYGGYSGGYGGYLAAIATYFRVSQGGAQRSSR